jgi:hypothetical protein
VARDYYRSGALRVTTGQRNGRRYPNECKKEAQHRLAMQCEFPDLQAASSLRPRPVVLTSCLLRTTEHPYAKRWQTKGQTSRKSSQNQCLENKTLVYLRATKPNSGLHCACFGRSLELILEQINGFTTVYGRGVSSFLNSSFTLQLRS